MIADIWSRLTASPNDGSLTDQATTAFDVADDWSRFPRYGFLTRFSDDVSAADMLAPLRDYKINVVQYYDWMDEHHIPYRPGFDYWQDIAARDPWVSRVKLNQLIALGRQYNMAALAYNLMYGAYDDYATESGLSLSSGMFTSPLDTNGYSLADQDRHELNIAGWETQRLYLFNPADQSWRDWIALQFQTAFAALPFDGWHIDTLGERGPRYDSTGAEFDLAATYSGFVNDMRAQLGPDKPLVVNTVSNYGLTPVAQHADVAVLYSELWNGALEDEFYDLKLTLDSARAVTDKPMVIAGYMNYDAAQQHTSQSPGAFNEPGILLADAAIFANGGWHIELGDGLNMLSNEYFPRQALIMSPSLQAKLLGLLQLRGGVRESTPRRGDQRQQAHRFRPGRVHFHQLQRVRRDRLEDCQDPNRLGLRDRLRYRPPDQPDRYDQHDLARSRRLVSGAGGHREQTRATVLRRRVGRQHRLVRLARRGRRSSRASH
jgi:dextranase